MGRRLRGVLFRLLAAAVVGALLWILLPLALSPVSAAAAKTAALCAGLSFLSPSTARMVQSAGESTEEAYPVGEAAPAAEEEKTDEAEDEATNTAQEEFPDPADESPAPEENVGTVLSQTYREGSTEQYLALSSGWVRNLSGLGAAEVLSLSEQELPFSVEVGSDQPQVLIYHTHATESYLPSLRGWYSLSESFRSQEEAKNMIAVGNVLASVLEQAGIRVIHDTAQHDSPSYTGAYDRSRASVQKYLEEYPSIQIALDVHRDAITRDDNTIVAPTATIDGVQVSQVMIIACAKEESIPSFRENFKFAAALQKTASADYPDLMRPILFDQDRFYNQDLTTGSLLLEFGGHANTLAQAKRAAKLVGESLVKTLGAA